MSFSIDKVASSEQADPIHVAFSDDSKFYAVSYSNGHIVIYDANTNRVMDRSRFHSEPCPCIAWRPKSFDPAKEEPAVYGLAVVTCAGAYGYLSFDCSDPAAPVLYQSSEKLEEGNESQVCDVSPDGCLVATAGSDHKVRIYNIKSKELHVTMDKGYDDGGHVVEAHGNRIFACKWFTERVVVTAGWGSPVQVFDVKEEKAIMHFRGPQVGSDAIDFIPGTPYAIVSSNRKTNQVTVFDVNLCREHKDLSQKLNESLGTAVIAHLCCTPTGFFAATISPKSQIRYVDLETCQVKVLLDDFPVPVAGMGKAPAWTDKCVVVGTDDTVAVVQYVPGQ